MTVIEIGSGILEKVREYVILQMFKLERHGRLAIYLYSGRGEYLT
jgi:hypothetical protein